MDLKVFCVGDVVGRPGRAVLSAELPPLVKQRGIDCVIVNAENAAGGSGLTPQIYEKLLRYGVHLITLGDHCFRKRDIFDILKGRDNVVRPANLSPQAIGRDVAIHTTAGGVQVAVVCLLGRLFMNPPSENPFLVVNHVLGRLPSSVKVVFVEMHAEATSEKIAMGWHLNGRVSCVYGTHTHVATADETILSDGTAYMTDLGMTGPHKSVLGRNIDPVVRSLVTQMPYPYSVATDDVRVNGLLVTVDGQSGRALEVERICLRGESDRQGPYDEADGHAPGYFGAS